MNTDYENQTVCLGIKLVQSSLNERLTCSVQIHVPACMKKWYLVKFNVGLIPLSDIKFFMPEFYLRKSSAGHINLYHIIIIMPHITLHETLISHKFIERPVLEN